MNTLLLGVRVLLFALSTFGYMTLLHRRSRISVSFLPALVFTGQICVLFLAGILNLLPQAVWILFLVGLFLAVRSFKFREQYRDFLEPTLFFFALACLYFLFLLKGALFTGYDNFSHWALVVKQMLLTDRFPTFQDTIILFQGYPLGSSAFIYYVSKVISPASEGCQMFAQTMLTLSLVLPLFSGVQKRKLPAFLLLAGSSLFFLSYITTPDSLYVDTVLPLTGAVAYLLLSRELREKRPTTWLTVFPAVAVILIKNSGLFFWALIAGRILIYWLGHRKATDAAVKRSWAAAALLPPAAFYLWSRHVKYVFATSSSSPHSISLSAYAANIQSKLADGSISQITRAFFNQVLHGRVIFYVLVLLALAALYTCLRHSPKTGFGGLALFLVLVYAAYQLGNLCMYLFSMPEGEAVVMAGYSRYYGTIAIFCVAIALCHISAWFDTAALPCSYVAVFVFFFVFSLAGIRPGILTRTTDFGQRADLEHLIQEYQIAPETACLVYVANDDASYAYHLVKYALYTPTVDEHRSCDGEDPAVVIQTAIDLGYDYLIDFDTQNETLNAYCQQRFGVPAGTRVIKLQSFSV